LNKLNNNNNGGGSGSDENYSDGAGFDAEEADDDAKLSKIRH
jgi:hypothetical protein